MSDRLVWRVVIIITGRPTLDERYPERLPAYRRATQAMEMGATTVQVTRIRIKRRSVRAERDRYRRALEANRDNGCQCHCCKLERGLTARVLAGGEP
jgi:hypothetical protein